MNDDVFFKFYLFYYYVKYTKNSSSLFDNYKPYLHRGYISDYIGLTFGNYVTTITIIIMNYDL